MITKELLAVKEYLLENLYKGFIVPSSSFFASPVFVTNLALALGLQGLRHVKLGAQLCI
jgi:hypothetical protein